MKRIFLLIVAFVSLNSAMAQSSDVKRVINKYDVKKLADGLPKNNPALFWKAIEDNNKMVQKMLKALKNNNQNLMTLLETTYNNLNILDRYDDLAPKDWDLMQRLSRDLGIEEETRRFPIKFINDNTLNASMDPRGQMRINIGTLRYLTYEELVAVCAHETAHNYCEHVMARMWKKDKKQRRNREWARVGYAFTAGAITMSGGYAAQYGQNTQYVDDFFDNAGIVWSNFRNYADQATIRYYYRYSRDEEIEADIIAYRFMEYMGYNTNHWISAMRKILNVNGDYRYNADKYDDHPTTLFRIDVLQAMKNGYVGK